MKKAIYRISVFSIVLLLTFSIVIYRIPPKPVEAFAPAIAIPVIAIGAVGVLLAATGVALASDQDFSVTAQAMWSDLSLASQNIIMNAVNNPFLKAGAMVVAYERSVYNSLMDEISLKINNFNTTGLTDEEATYSNLNGTEGVYASTAVPAIQSRLKSYSVNQTDGVYYNDFLDGTNNLVIEVSANNTFVKLYQPNGGYFNFTSNYGSSTYGSNPINVHMSKVEYPTYNGFNMSGSVLLTGTTYSTWNFGLSCNNILVDGVPHTGNLYVDTNTHLAFITENGTNYYFNDYLNIQSVEDLMFRYVYERQVDYSQNSDYIHNVGTNNINNNIDPEDTIIMPKVDAPDVPALTPEYVTEFAVTNADGYVDLPVDEPIPETIGGVIGLLNPASPDFFLTTALVPSPDFIPNNFNNFNNKFKLKFPWISAIKRIMDEFTGALDDGKNGGKPEFLITLPSKYGGVTVPIINFDFYDEYRDLILNFMSMIAIYLFARRQMKRLPKIIYL